MSIKTNHLISYLNSYEFINFLSNLTGIKEKLIPDPYLWGAGYHELKDEGFLNVHADFNLHPELKLNRRINLLIYLNKDWQENYGGSLELWNREMKNCIKKLLQYLIELLFLILMILVIMEILKKLNTLKK